MIALVEGAERQKTRNEIALNILLAGLTIIFLLAVVTLLPYAIYIGAAPGVGKTYQILEDAHHLKRQGQDIVIGFIEPHGRADTEALIDDLECVPLRRIEYRGVTLGEMDVVAVIARKPQIAIVDELAYTNAPGSNNKKRYE